MAGCQGENRGQRREGKIRQWVQERKARRRSDKNGKKKIQEGESLEERG